MSVTATYKGVCAKCGDDIRIGDDIEPGPPHVGGWAHAVCPEDEEINFDDRPRCRWCGSPLTPDFECGTCERVG